MRKNIFVLFAVIALSGCSIEEVKKAGSACSPTLTAGDYAVTGEINCFADRMTGRCIDNDGVCIYTDDCRNCEADFRECRRYQADFDKLVANAQSPDRKYVTHVNGEEDLSPYSSLFVSGSLNRCPSDAPYCVWDPDGEGLVFGCIECSKTVCGSDCVDTEISLENCGACGNVCPERAQCRDGQCVCSSGEIVCDGKCVNPLSDMNYCGAHDSCGGDESGVKCLDFQVCKDGKCVGDLKCEADQHVYASENGIQCEADSLENCGTHGLSCLSPGWESGSCKDGKCIVDACKAGFHIDKNDGTCVEDTNACCGSDCISCSDDGMFCTKGRCMSNCLTGEDLCSIGSERVCADLSNNIHHCGACGADCQTSGVDNSTTVICRDRRCIADSCHPGYHVYDGICEIDDDDNCGIHGSACTADKIDGSLTTGCAEGKCAAASCRTGFHLHQGICEADDNGNCGAHGVVCSTDSVENSKSVSCSAGKCAPKICNEHYHVYGSQCEADSDEHCGAHAAGCSREMIDGSVKVACLNSVCSALTCKTGYHVYAPICEKDDLDNCGKHDRLCDVGNLPGAKAAACIDGVCRAHSCNAGYHLFKNLCEADSNDHCGAHAVICSVDQVANSVTVECRNGMCAATSCKSGYAVVSGKCEKITESHCPKGLLDCRDGRCCKTNSACINKNEICIQYII